jgi:formylglycine-generating enzyme required for sulfatase activity
VYWRTFSADLSGNVWEWTSSVFQDYPTRPGDGREDEEGGALARVVRGGVVGKHKVCPYGDWDRKQSG